MTDPRVPHIDIRHGDALAELAKLPDNSVHAIVTDPPYGLAALTPEQVADTLARWLAGDRDYMPTGRGFMGKSWDAFVPPPAVWDECLRVLKPGGHLLAFAGSRTQDLMGLSIRLAGFEIRDSVAWLYGSGFPKSLDVSKAIDKLDAADERRARALEFTAWMRSTGITAKQIDELTGTHMGDHYLTNASQPAVATADLFDKLRPHLPEVPARIEELVAQRTVESKNYKARPITGTVDEWADRTNYAMTSADGFRRDIPATPAAKQWDGWGTALKPAHEPVIVARKPLEGTVAANVLEHGTGALNIDACRVNPGDPVAAHRQTEGTKVALGTGWGSGYQAGDAATTPPNTAGRWPANVVLDEAAAAELDRQSGFSKSPPVGSVANTAARIGQVAKGDEQARVSPNGYGDSGGASRFFYVAKAPKRERPVVEVDGRRVAHSTVKPLTLMRHLVRLVTPPGGVVLDPFAGSGTTLEAAALEGFDSIGIEREADYLPLIAVRVERVKAAPITELEGTGAAGSG